MKKGIVFSLSILFLSLLIGFSGCTGTMGGQNSNQNIQAESTVSGNGMVEVTEMTVESAIETPTENEQYIPVSQEYMPMWAAGTLLSDVDRVGWCLITRVNRETSEYYFRNVIHPEVGQPYIIKDSSFEEMGSRDSAQGIDKKYVNYEGKAVKIPIVSKTGSTILGYLKYHTNETMKHILGE